MTDRRFLARTLAAAALVAPVSAVLVPASAAAEGEIRITEYMYSGGGGEFVELTNVGDAAVDMTGWSYDDDSATPGVLDLSGFGVVEPGESVVFTEDDPAAFRSDWSLGAGVDVVGPYSNNIGRGDQINIYDANDELADRLTYGDEDFSGSIRTQGASGWVTTAGLGADDAFEWVLSNPGDAEDSVVSSNGDIGSPGRSTHGGPSDPVDSDEQSISVTVPDVGPGEFVWSIDGDGAVDLGETTDQGSYLGAAGAIDPIVVTDTREGGPEWSISGQVSDFSDDLPGSLLGWTPQVIDAGAGATAGDPVASGIDGGDGLSVPATLASSADGHEAGTGTVGADLDLRLPVETDPGDYTATLTITALS